MSEEDRNAMIQTMVAGLDARLRENPQDPEGWARLLRSYVMLGDKQAASDALARGRQALGEDSDAARELVALAGSLGLPATE